MWKRFKSLISTRGSVRRNDDVRPEDAIDRELLYAAIKQGNLKRVTTLIKQGADVNASCKSLRDSTFLHVAVLDRRYEIVQILIEHGADVNAREKLLMRSPIYFAVWNNDENITKLLLSSGADLKDMDILLSLALQLENIKIAEILLQHNPDFNINATNENGKTILFNVISLPSLNRLKLNGPVIRDYTNEDHRKTKLVEFCFNEGANVNAKNIDGETALHAAIYHGLVEVVEKLLEYGAEVDVKDDSRKIRTPLMTAVQDNRLSVVRSLLKFLPNSELKDTYGRTALSYAMQYASPCIVHEILNYGADINATDECNLTLYNAFPNRYDNVTILELHTHKIRALEPCVNSKNLTGFHFQEKLYNDCKREIELMKRTMMGDSIISLHAILTKRLRKVAMCAKNENILNAFNNIMDDYVTIFPMYFVMMYYRFLKSIKLEPLLTSSAKSLDLLIGFELPYVVSMELLDYLSIEDLKNLIKASPTIDQLTTSQ